MGRRGYEVSAVSGWIATWDFSPLTRLAPLNGPTYEGLFFSGGHSISHSLPIEPAGRVQLTGGSKNQTVTNNLRTWQHPRVQRQNVAHIFLVAQKTGTKMEPW